MTIAKGEPIQTKWGIAKVANTGYYSISENSKGHYRKLLHRLIFEDFYNVDLDKEFPNGVIIHHNDGNKLNNKIWNLIPMSREEHNSVHFKGKVISEEHKWRISESNKNKIVSEETRRKISKANKGRKAWNKGVPMREDVKKRLIKSLKGRKVSEETRRKLSEANKGEKNYWYGRKFTKEHIENLRKSHLGKKLSAETRRKMSETQKGRTAPLEKKLKQSKTMNKSGFFNVFKLPSKQCRQGFTWAFYYYDENNKRRILSSTNLKKLKDKVLANNFEWILIDVDNAKKTCAKYEYDLEDLI